MNVQREVIFVACIWVFSIFLTRFSFGMELIEVPLSSKDALFFPSWVQSEGPEIWNSKKKVKTVKHPELERIKIWQTQGRYTDCLESVESLYRRYPILGDWIAINEIICLHQMLEKTQDVVIADLNIFEPIRKELDSGLRLFVTTSQNHKSVKEKKSDKIKRLAALKVGSAPAILDRIEKRVLRATLIEPEESQKILAFALTEVRLIVSEIFSIRENKVQFEKSVNSLLERVESMNSIQKLRTDVVAAELFYRQQKLEAALSLLNRATHEEAYGLASLRSLVDEKINKIQVSQDPSPVPPSTEGAQVVQVASFPHVEPSAAVEDEFPSPASSAEQELYERLKKEFESLQFVAAAEDAAQLIEDFPGGVRARFASQKLIEILFAVLAKGDKKYHEIVKNILSQMLKLDGLRQLDWGKQLFWKGHFELALKLFRPSLNFLKGTPMETELLFIAARGAGIVGDRDLARKLFNELISRHYGTKESKLASFFLGLIEIKDENFSAASFHLEKYISVTKERASLLPGYYWLWRAEQLKKNGQPEPIAKKLVEEFPLTYYGLRAQIERQQEIVLPKALSEVSAVMWLTAHESKLWTRANLLMNIGWMNEAQTELRQLPAPQSLKEKLLRARYWAACRDYRTAIAWVDSVWTLDKSLFVEPIVRLVYPVEFQEFIKEESKIHRIDEHLVNSLIRQESAFQIRAVSRSKAMGLMQLIGPTAEEVAQSLNLKNFYLPESLFDPKTNIKFGTRYFSQMLKSFDGSVPFALAAYNLGPTRLRKWLSYQPDLQQKQPVVPVEDSGALGIPLPKIGTELWLDELPWSETGFYVKAILRNVMIYRHLDKDRPRK